MGTAVANGVVVVGTGGVALAGAPATVAGVAAAAKAGAVGGVAVIKFLDGIFSGVDNLVININGEKVFPSGGKLHYGIKAGETITPNIRFDFESGARVQFLEYDSGSDHDNLGSIDILPAKWDDKTYYEETQVILYNDVEGDMYFVDYRVEKNSKGHGEKWMLCGTAACKICGEPGCTKTSNYGLDRDGDKEDLRKCPPGFKEIRFKRYPQTWPFVDVYLRVCSNCVQC